MAASSASRSASAVRKRCMTSFCTSVYSPFRAGTIFEIVAKAALPWASTLTTSVVAPLTAAKIAFVNSGMLFNSGKGVFVVISSNLKNFKPYFAAIAASWAGERNASLCAASIALLRLSEAACFLASASNCGFASSNV